MKHPSHVTVKSRNYALTRCMSIFQKIQLFPIKKEEIINLRKCSLVSTPSRKYSHARSIYICSQYVVVTHYILAAAHFPVREGWNPESRLSAPGIEPVPPALMSEHASEHAPLNLRPIRRYTN